MKALVFKEFGGLENLSLDDVPVPRVGQGSVLLRAAAASINPVAIIRYADPNTFALDEQADDTTTAGPSRPNNCRAKSATEKLLWLPR